MIYKCRIVSQTGKPGFRKPIEIYFQKDQTLNDILINLNKYRSPVDQIRKLFDQNKREIDLSNKPESKETYFIE